MSILIRGMDMPKNCFECCFSGDNGNGRMWCLAHPLWLDICIMQGVRHEDCPLVEVPTPHGRLIDADELEKFELPATLFPEGRESNIDVWTHAVAVGNIKNAMTLIEAED